MHACRCSLGPLESSLCLLAGGPVADLTPRSPALKALVRHITALSLLPLRRCGRTWTMRASPSLAIGRLPPLTVLLPHPSLGLRLRPGAAAVLLRRLGFAAAPLEVGLLQELPLQPRLPRCTDRKADAAERSQGHNDDEPQEQQGAFPGEDDEDVAEVAGPLLRDAQGRPHGPPHSLGLAAEAGDEHGADAERQGQEHDRRDGGLQPGYAPGHRHRPGKRGHQPLAPTACAAAALRWRLLPPGRLQGRRLGSLARVRARPRQVRGRRHPCARGVGASENDGDQEGHPPELQTSHASHWRFPCQSAGIHVRNGRSQPQKALTQRPPAHAERQDCDRCLFRTTPGNAKLQRVGLDPHRLRLEPKWLRT
mmetsp:Transcript_83222/g.258384  ORF Transcript_83222/g.258384 Transcript_83222/m.258384 type:complete len:366 (+) Transcript_83222:831-1928(+)